MWYNGGAMWVCEGCCDAYSREVERKSYRVTSREGDTECGGGDLLEWSNIGVSPSGKAKDFDSFIRKFESCYPCQPKKSVKERFKMSYELQRFKDGEVLSAEKLNAMDEQIKVNSEKSSSGGGTAKLYEHHLKVQTMQMPWITCEAICYGTADMPIEQITERVARVLAASGNFSPLDPYDMGTFYPVNNSYYEKISQYDGRIVLNYFTDVAAGAFTQHYINVSDLYIVSDTVTEV